MAQRSSWASYVIWGSVAVCAVLASAVTIALVVGNHRGIQIAGIAKRPAPPPASERSVAPAAPSETVVINAPDARDHEIARLNDALRTLAAERDRLDERLRKLEQNLGDITASIRERTTEGAAPAAQLAPRIPVAETEARPAEGSKSEQRIAAAPTQLIPPAAATRGTPPAGAIAATGGGEVFLPYVSSRPLVLPPSGAQEPMEIHAVPLGREVRAHASTASRTEFAVDLGTEPNMDALRGRWTTLRTAHGPILGALRPLVSMREGGRPGSVELRLIAGPIVDAGDAARTCASLQARGVNCQTAVFDGQRLALH